MSAAQKFPVPNDSFLEIKSSSGQRRKVMLDKPMLTIGRDLENDLSLSEDPKVSRKHCEIVKHADGRYLIRNVSQKNFVYVNGEEIMQKFVEQTCHIRIGEQEFDLVIPERTKTVTTPMQATPAPRKPTPIQTNVGQIPPVYAAPAKKMNPFYFIVGILVVAGLWSYFSGPQGKKEQVTIRTEDKIANDVKQSQDNVKSMTERMEKAGEQSLQFKAANEHYIKGFRDYRQRQYSRALSSFQAALAFYPNHELARKYYSLSKRRFDEQVQNQMILGRRYKGKNNFRLCKSSFAGVMVMMKDPSDPIYKEAKQYFDECSLSLEGRF